MWGTSRTVLIKASGVQILHGLRCTTYVSVEDPVPTVHYDWQPTGRDDDDRGDDKSREPRVMTLTYEREPWDLPSALRDRTSATHMSNWAIDPKPFLYKPERKSETMYTDPRLLAREEYRVLGHARPFLALMKDAAFHPISLGLNASADSNDLWSAAYRQDPCLAFDAAGFLIRVGSRYAELFARRAQWSSRDLVCRVGLHALLVGAGILQDEPQQDTDRGFTRVYDELDPEDLGISRMDRDLSLLAWVKLLML